MKRWGIDPAWFKHGAQFLAAVAAVIAMSIVFVNRQSLSNQLEHQDDVSSCRSRLTADVTLATAENQVAFSNLLLTLTPPRDVAGQAAAVSAIKASGVHLTNAARLRKSFEDDPTQPCPIPEVKP